MTIRRTSARRALAAVAVLPLALAAAACGSSSGNDASATSKPAAKVDTSKLPAGTWDTKAATGSPVKIGVLNPDGSLVSDPESKKIAAAVIAYANDHLGGLGGHKIVEDYCAVDEGTPSVAAACANKFVHDGVAGVVNTVDGGDGAAPGIIAPAGIAYTTWQQPGPAALNMDNSFSWTAGTIGVVGGMAQKAAADKAKNFTIYVTDQGKVVAGFSALANPIFKAVAPQIKLTIQGVTAGAADASPQITAGLKDKPESVAVVGDDASCAQMLSALQTAGYKGKLNVIPQCLSQTVFDAIGGTSYVDGAYDWGYPQSADDTPEQNLLDAIIDTYAPGDQGSALAGAYQAMLSFVRMVNAGAGSNDVSTKAGIIAAIKAAKDVPMPLGDGKTMTCNAPMPTAKALCSTGSMVYTVKDGKNVDGQAIQ